MTAREVHDAILRGDYDLNLEWLRLAIENRWAEIRSIRKASLDKVSLLLRYTPQSVDEANEWFGIAVAELARVFESEQPLTREFTRDLIDIHGRLHRTFKKFENDPEFDQTAYDKANRFVLQLFGVDPDKVQS